MIVMKFGGTSVESEEAVARVASIVKAQAHRRPIVVVSAMGKTTNKLLAAATEAAAGRRDRALALIDELRAHHLFHGLALAGSSAADLDRYIRAHFDWLDELVKGLAVVGELSPRSMDAIASVGERLFESGCELCFPRGRSRRHACGFAPRDSHRRPLHTSPAAL